MLDPFILVANHKKSATLTLNRPKAYNALNLDMIQSIHMSLKKWRDDPTVGFVILQSHIDRVFCAGGDIKAVYQNQHNTDYVRTFFQLEYELNAIIYHYPKPIISLINGLTLGGGMGLSMYSTYRVVNENALLGMPETTIGFFPDVGAGYFYNKLAEPLGLYLALTGTLLSPKEALMTGLASLYVSSSKWGSLINDLKECDDKDTIEHFLERYHEPQDFSSNFPFLDVINECFTARSVEEIFDRLKKHPSKFAKDCHQTLLTKSPTSLKVTFKKFKQNKGWSLQDVLRQDFLLSQNFIKHPDPIEGIRAQVIDKDKSPKWNPSTLKDVSNEMVNSFFYSPKA
ncbi:MAG: enoyl-CoA hydratase/isomerase family protein [Alphaproteobacteria bacterium]|nr:enoyl-CoA hydratase/isomerase family protein [Alphaproteobacteria bacterium]